MRHTDISKSAVAAALVFALSVFCFTLFVWVSFGGSVPLGAQGYRVAVQFGPEASNVFPNADVRISGVTVGDVAEVRTRAGRIDLELELESKYAPLPRDARAIVRSKTLLGEAYIELTPGTKAAGPVPDGGRLAQANVQTAQGLDRALSAFDARTRRDLRDFMEGVAEAFAGRGPDASAALGNFPLAVEDLRALVDVLDRQGGAVSKLVRDTGTALDTIAERGADARTIARAGSRVFATTAERDRELAETVRATPRFLRAVRAVSDDTTELSRAVAPALRALRPVAPLVEPGLRETRLLAPDLRRALAALGDTIEAGEDGLPALTRVLRASAPLLRALDPAGSQLVPLIRALEAFRNDGVRGFASAAAAMNAGVRRPDGTLQRYLRVLSHFSNESVHGQTTRSSRHRENAYPAPNAQAFLARGEILRALDCTGASEATGGPPCLTQEPYSLAGSAATQYPRVPADTSK